MSKLITKNGQTIKALAAQFMLINEGGRIPRVEDFSEQLHVGRGTVQSALGFLRDEGAIQLEASGHLGTKLIKLDKKKLWAIAGYTNIVGTMPLPYSKRYEGLATALCAAFENEKIPFSIAYQRGAGNRISGVLSGRYDFAVCSRLSVDYSVRENASLAAAAYLGRNTFVGGHALITREGAGSGIWDGMRIAVDRSSIDQMLMTERLTCGHRVTLVDCTYNQLTSVLESNMVDGAIWNADEFEEKFSPNNFKKVELSTDQSFGSTEATLICRKADQQLIMLFKEIIKPEIISEIQNEVINNRRLPKY